MITNYNDQFRIRLEAEALKLAKEKLEEVLRPENTTITDFVYDEKTKQVTFTLKVDLTFYLG